MGSWGPSANVAVPLGSQPSRINDTAGNDRPQLALGSRGGQASEDLRRGGRHVPFDEEAQARLGGVHKRDRFSGPARPQPLHLDQQSQLPPGDRRLAP